MEKVRYREATLKDAKDIAMLEKKVWKDNAASYENIVSRMKIFPTGSIIGIYNEKIVGYVSGIKMSQEYADECKTWYDYTDSGKGVKSYSEDGELLFGISLTVDNDYRNLGIGSRLLIQIARMAIENNLKAGILGGRLPYYYKKKEMAIEEYIELKNESGKIFDPELRLYKKMGLKIVKLQKDYFHDPESLDYGVILEWNNPFYRITKMFPFLSKPLSYLFRI
jgi:ribosomal protein S18 acetylase RimI-like enzyme